MASCGKDEVTVNPSETNSTFIGYIDDDDTKVTLVDGVKICWVEGDKISINGKTYTATPDPDDPRKAVFTLTSLSAPTGTTFRACYPVESYTTAGKFYFQESQNYSIANPLQYVNQMYAETNEMDGTLHFKNVGGLLAIDLKGEGTVSKIEISSSDFIAGVLTDFAISESGDLTYGAFDRYSYNKISLGCGSAATLSTETARRFYVSLPEGKFSDLKVTVVTDEGAMTIPATKDVKIEKNNIYHLPEITVDIKPLEFDAELTIDVCEATSPSSVNLAVSVAPIDEDIYYIMDIKSSAEVKEYKNNLELAKAHLEYLKSIGGTTLSILTYNDIAIKGDMNKFDVSKNPFIDLCKPGEDYVFYVYAIDEYLNVSEAKTLPFSTPEYKMPASSATYEDYLGQWAMGATLITVSQKVAGSTYNISGIKGQSQGSPYNYNVEAVEAYFDNGYIVLKEQKTNATTSIGSYGMCDIYLSGIYSYYGDTYGHYPFDSEIPETIFYGRLDGDTISLIPGSCEYGTFISMGFSWVIQSGEYAGLGSTFAGTALSKMTKYEEPTGPTPEGQWYCASVTDYYWGDEYTDWTLNITKSGAGYAIEGFDVGLEYYVSKANIPTAVWDSEKSTLTVANETSTGLADSAEILWVGFDDDNNPVDIVFKFDFENNTCTTLTAFGAFENDPYYGGYWWSQYGPGVVFTKLESLAPQAKSMSTRNSVNRHNSSKKVNSNLKAVIDAPKSCQKQAANGMLLIP